MNNRTIFYRICAGIVAALLFLTMSVIGIVSISCILLTLVLLIDMAFSVHVYKYIVSLKCLGNIFGSIGLLSLFVGFIMGFFEKE